MAQSAVLAAMPQAPSIYLPFVLETNTEDNVSYIVSATDEAGNKYYPLNPKNAERAKLVLNKMLELKYIVKAEYDIAIQQIDSGNVGLRPESASSTVYSYFTDALYEQLLKDMVNKYGYTQESAQDTLLNGGLVIHSTLDPQIQSILEKMLLTADSFLLRAQQRVLLAQQNPLPPVKRSIISAMRHGGH